MAGEVPMYFPHAKAYKAFGVTLGRFGPSSPREPEDASSSAACRS